MANHNQRFQYCDDCKKVVRVDLPECVHFGAFVQQKNAESSMVVFRSADGKVSIPWEPNAKCPAGYQREEVRGARNVRKLERELDAKDLARHRQHQEKMERFMAPINSSMREGLKAQMRNARHPFEKDLAQAALDHLDRGYSDRYDAGNHRD
jgi:hypothetical protein